MALLRLLEGPAAAAAMALSFILMILVVLGLA
jgi:hypothetical protein